MINNLKEITNNLIRLNQDNPLELKKYQLIKEILKKKDCFLNINIEYAYSILRDLNIPEVNIKETYIKLIDCSKQNNYEQSSI